MTSGQEENNSKHSELSVSPLSKETLDSKVIRYAGSPGQKGIIILPIEEYRNRFNKRYENETYFRNRVHDYLGISKAQKFKLGVGEIFARSWYQKTTRAMIDQYSQVVFDDLMKAKKLEDDLAKFNQMKLQLEGQAKQVRNTNRDALSVERTFAEEVAVREVAVAEKKQELNDNLQKESEQFQVSKQEVVATTDVREIVRVKLNQVIRGSSLVKVNQSGEIVFNEAKVVKKLEDMFLDEVVAEIESDGFKDFMRKMQSEYDGVVSHYADLEDLSELGEVDWVDSIVLSRSKGYRVPVFPYLVAAKYQTKESIRPTIDSAISVDVSGSMDQDGKFDSAKKASLALHAVERKINPNNSVYLSVFSRESIRDVTTREMMNDVFPGGGTPTHLALKWGLDKLRDSKCGVVYLVTDGQPNDQYMDACVEEAKKYKDYPHVMLRVFLVDGDDESRTKIKKIGSAAGQMTRVACVKGKDLAKGVVKDFSECIGQMKSIDNF